MQGADFTAEIYSLLAQEYSEEIMRVQHDTIRCKDLENGVTDIHDDHPGRSRIWQMDFSAAQVEKRILEKQSD